jgi:uncharacterized protein (TIGR02271 family)
MIQGTYAGNRRTITAFFDQQDDADEAVERLVEDGISRDRISLVRGSGEGQVSGSAADEAPGFWEALKDMFLPDEDRATYAEGLRRGGYVVTVQADDAHYERAIDILDDEGTVNLDERAASWRREGWTGSEYVQGSRGVAATSSMGTSEQTGREEVIPVAEEQLRVGKRDVSHGRVRVRSYVVETPVEEQVALREEHVHVERRPVDRPVQGNEQLFQDRVIEADERAEEVVVSKDARVKEELVVKKDVGERTETVSDKVRSTQVEVDDGRVGTASKIENTARTSTSAPSQPRNRQ